FSADGDYIAGFGGSGSGAQQLDLKNKTGIAASLGRVWVADGGNHRLAEWAGGIYEPSEEPVLVEDDPQLEVNVSEGLVDSVEGEESGAIDYDHSGDLLTAVDAPDGEAQFSYDGAGRMTKVSLPNGTYGEIAYEATYGRVKSVTTAIEGKNPKTTHFSWSDEPHRTTVTPPDAPATTYDIAADGSIFKWWNAKQPPVFDDVAGTLFQNRETSTPISTGVHNLVIQAHDEEGVASIQVIANNNQLVDERTCSYDPEKPTECVTETNEWVTETGNWPPGIVYLEVIATDRLGEASSQRFWVNIPYTPPPDPEAEEPPRFGDILRFREEFGLDLDLKGDELAINDRVFELMGDWNNPLTPAGEVARATNEKWGVPLRALDAAELEYRQSYVDQASTHLKQWVNSSGVENTYAGYYVDDRAGGIVRLGFTNNQENLVNLFKSDMPFLPSDRIQAFQASPGHSLGTLEALATDLRSRRINEPAITEVVVNSRTNAVDVGASNVPLVQSAVNGWYGQSAPISVRYLANADEPKDVRERLSGPMRAGDRVVDDHWQCTLGFGARESTGEKSNGEAVVLYFGLTAAHCFETVGEPVFRTGLNSEGQYKEVRIGNMTRTGFGVNFNGYGTDGQAVKLKEPGLVPKWIQVENFYTQKIHGAAPLKENMIVCTTGITSGTASCGRVRLFEEVEYNGRVMLQFNVQAAGPEGNSGGPVWDLMTGAAVGLTSSGPEGPAEWRETNVTPLLPVPGAPNNGVPGILAAPGMGALSIVAAK
ncbi:MAG TPA: trypsin-like serine protease, partial [Nitrospira sp.]|nr:trypsin-like serine protease [Nitrospira sp.]